MRWSVLFAMSALMFGATDASAQVRGIELQAGAGFVFDAGEGPSVPTAVAGATGWITRGWGIGVRLSEGLREDDLRLWSLTSQWRGFAGRTEVNVAIGVGGHGYRYKPIEHSAERQGSRSGSGFLAFELLLGRRLRGPLHVKGGFTYGLAGDLHPFQPVVMLAFTP